jgi:butyrate kinase
VNDAASDGPFSPERTGGLPLQQFITLCFSGTYPEPQVRSLVMGQGGLTAYLGTNSAMEVEQRIARGDDAAREVYEAMAYQIAKEIGAMATVLEGKIDAIILTGGLASSNMLVKWIGGRVRFLGRTLVYPGEHELQALALGALRVLRGEEQPREYI